MTHPEHPLLAALQSGRLPRREFVQRALAAGAALGPIGTLLAACGDAARDHPVVIPDQIESELAIYNWSDYIGEDTIAGFEREFGVRVIYDTYESNEDLIAKLQAGAVGYDLIVPTGYAIRVLRALDLLLPVERALLPNWEHLFPQFLGQEFDPDNTWTVPWMWGTAGVAYRSDLVTAPDSWAVFLDTGLRGKLTQLDDMRDVIGCWLKYRGHSLNSTEPAELEAAKADALRAKPNLKSYVSAPVKGQLIVGDVWVAHLWNGDTAQARTEQDAIEFAVPREGSMIYLDSLAIPRGARHLRAAHEFMNYVLRPEVAAGIADRTGYGSPNAGAPALQRHPLPPPEPEAMALLEFQEDLGQATALWDRIWTEIKAG